MSGRGRGAGRGRGRGEGRGRSAGRGRGGRGQSGSRQEQEIPSQGRMHSQSETSGEDDDAQFLVNNLDQVDDYVAFSESFAIDIDAVRADFIAFQARDPLLLLDSCSTLNDDG